MTSSLNAQTLGVPGTSCHQPQITAFPCPLATDLQRQGGKECQRKQEVGEDFYLSLQRSVGSLPACHALLPSPAKSSSRKCCFYLFVIVRWPVNAPYLNSIKRRQKALGCSRSKPLLLGALIVHCTNRLGGQWACAQAILIGTLPNTCQRFLVNQREADTILHQGSPAQQGQQRHFRVKENFPIPTFMDKRRDILFAEANQTKNCIRVPDEAHRNREELKQRRGETMKRSAGWDPK
ncbi:uncharacterized protein LOC112476447 [Pteropus alecto]|uniref:uncharacterized protein LOC112476447 n=1 Tax=Pteropus alecto TaxID=9402 RepID=UPI000D531EC5|nr:uncharacterized protein LOC112476447 [Pteropus alecto]